MNIHNHQSLVSQIIVQDSLLSQSAVTAGVAASQGEVEKDAHHEEAVLGARRIFIPLAVESLGLWSPASLNILRDIAVRTTNRSGASATVALYHFVEQLSVCMWRHSSFLHLISLLPVSLMWELSPDVGSSSHGFCHPEPLGLWHLISYIVFPWWFLPLYAIRVLSFLILNWWFSTFEFVYSLVVFATLSHQG